jgi:hypothetical protein
VGFSASFEDPISTRRIVQDARDVGRLERDESFSVSCTLFRREAPVVLTQPGPPASVPPRKSCEAGVMQQGDVERSLSFCAYSLCI